MLVHPKCPAVEIVLILLAGMIVRTGRPCQRSRGKMDQLIDVFHFATYYDYHSRGGGSVDGMEFGRCLSCGE
ncbi:hypothetical protein FF011L_51830 [Roseimaritima multifibrata]|uniref:Uncharacterized protein n=1 Tax=Roseimaritima multifibrata TaxID=1930274 RepID=A0A517MNB5_9BACT|nr:hypothetical protein FF011L_51830 [Roseimaritima multifibrata]